MKMEVQMQKNFLTFWSLLHEDGSAGSTKILTFCGLSPVDLGTDTTKFIGLLNPVTFGRLNRYEDLKDVHSLQTDLKFKSLC
jgi:hypothetical protein